MPNSKLGNKASACAALLYDVCPTVKRFFACNRMCACSGLRVAVGWTLATERRLAAFPLHRIMLLSVRFTGADQTMVAQTC